MINKLVFDIERGKKVAELLWNKGKDIFCKEKLMPEDIASQGFPKRSEELVLFLTFTVAIDYQRDAEKLWKAARRTYEDPDTNYLFNPQILSQTSIEKIREDLKRKEVPLRYPDKDPKFWKKLGETFYYKWNSNLFNLFEKYNYDAPKIFWEEISKNKSQYPYLSGYKIGPLWIRMLKDNAEIEKFYNLEKVPIPVDRHVARATLILGILRGQFYGSIESLYKKIREVWFKITDGLYFNSQKIISLDLDIPLWCLSKYFCSENRDTGKGSCKIKERCLLKNFCVKGKIILKDNRAEIDTELNNYF